MRRLLTVLALASCLTIPMATGSPAAESVKIRFTLDWKLQGIHAWYYWAKAKGYFAAENLDVTIDQGEGSAATVTRVTSGAYDAGFGDINAIIQNAATKPAETPGHGLRDLQQGPFRPADQGGRSDQEREGPWRLKARFTRGRRFVQTAAAAGQTKWRRLQQDQHHAGLAEPAGADADSGAN